ncbi:MAG: sel1 repeat family protein [Hyphomicrobiaceae bacterium]|nr:sel1 repeat family protein [Hyphomicrobiaceae bacterium]
MRLAKALMAVVVLATLAGPGLAAGETRSTAEAAFDQGLDAYRAGKHDAAIAALSEVLETGSEKDRFFARFYLARMFSDDSGPSTDHGRAYELFEQVIRSAGDDPDDRRRGPFISKSLIALAGYLRTGLPMAGVKPDVDRANDYLQDAASLYNDKDAQFELAKVQLTAEAASAENRLGMHYLSVLANEGHPGAQAYLANLYWRGRFVPQDSVRALALGRIAVENAPPQERVWIEDSYQNIFCGASPGVRKQAEGIITIWRTVFPRPVVSPEEFAAAARMPVTERFCKGGEIVDLGVVAKQPSFGGAIGTPAPAFVPPGSATFQGGGAGFGIIGAGVRK